MITYQSTRGKAAPLAFDDAVLAGLASDGGLYIPSHLPEFSPTKVASMGGASYSEVAYQVILPFVGEAIDHALLRDWIEETYRGFSHAAVAPLQQLGANEWVLELYHGPTLAFKDFALQLLGRIFDGILAKKNRRLTIIGATSGDTGSAAIAGCKDCANVDLFVMHPHNRVSSVQRRQMTTILSPNVHNIAVEGTFDDCQSLVKQCFEHPEFLEGKSHVAAINSINWARIVAQIVYYFYAASRLGSPARPMIFSVPTGNFGDIYAGYLAYRMGLPIEKLIIATNANDILHRFMETGVYERKDLLQTLSPSMDIQVSSNFERYIHDLVEGDGDVVLRLMQEFKTTGRFTLPQHYLIKARRIFTSGRASDDDILATMRDVYRTTSLVIDPHTAAGVFAARHYNAPRHIPVITLATAHPAKFPEAAQRAHIPTPPLPAHLTDLFSREERMDVLPASFEALTSYIAKKL